MSSTLRLYLLLRLVPDPVFPGGCGSARHNHEDWKSESNLKLLLQFLQLDRDHHDGSRNFVCPSHVEVPGLGELYESRLARYKLQVGATAVILFPRSTLYPLMDGRFSRSPEPLNYRCNALLECLREGRAGGRRHKYE